MILAVACVLLTLFLKMIEPRSIASWARTWGSAGMHHGHALLIVVGLYLSKR